MRLPIKDDHLEMWRRRLETAVKRLEQEGHLDKWRKIRAAYRGEEAAPDDEANNIQYILSTANSILPTIVAEDPFIHIRPRRPGDKRGATIAQAAVNFVWKRSRTTRVLQDAALYALLYGIGPIRTEYDAHDFVAPTFDSGGTKEVPGGDQLDPDQRADLMEAQSMVAFNDDPNDMPRARLVAPWSLLVPDGFASLTEMDWVGEMHMFRPDDLRHDYAKRFRVPKGLQATHVRVNGIPKRLSRGEINKGEAEYVAVYEIFYWRRKRSGEMQRTKLWLLADHGHLQEAVLAHEDDLSPVVGYPYTVLRFATDPGDFYATTVADLQAIMTLTESLNSSINHMLQHNRQQRERVYLVAKEILEQEGVSDGIANAEDGDCIGIDTGGRAIADVFAILPEARQPGDTSYLISTLDKLVLEISGVGVLQRGGMQRKGATATEASIANQGFQSRSAIRLARVDEAIEDVAGHYLAFIREFWEEPRYISVVGGEEDFVTFTSSEIEGQYDVDIQSGSTLPTDPGSEQQALVGLASFLGQNLGMLLPLVQQGILPKDVITEFIREAFSAFRMDQKALAGPLAGLANATATATAPAAGGGGGAPGAGGPPGPGQGDDGSGNSLAGSGPRPGPGAGPMPVLQ